MNLPDVFMFQCFTSSVGRSQTVWIYTRSHPEQTKAFLWQSLLFLHS